MSQPIVIIGAGLAGLVCARRLHQVGFPVLLLEKDSRPGGRLKTDVVDGFRLDRGFQVYFGKYPHAALELDPRKLNFCTFEPGCLVLDGGRLHEVHRDHIVSMAFSSYLPLGDKMRVVQWTNEVCAMSDAEIWSMKEMPAAEYLRSQGFSEAFLEKFVIPFFGGIFLDRSLTVSNRPLAFYWKMLSRKLSASFNDTERADTLIPALGMEEIPKQIAADLPASAFRFGVTASMIVIEAGRATGVQLETGEIIAASAVVVASDPLTATALTGIATVRGGKGCTTVHFAAPERPIDEPILVVSREERTLVSHVAVMSNVSRALAPAGQHLISATSLGVPKESDLYHAKSMRFELKTWFPKANVEAWRPLRVDRIPFAQMPQGVGVLDSLPKKETSAEGLYLAGEYTAYAGIDGAIKSGQQCAAAILASRKESLIA